MTLTEVWMAVLAGGWAGMAVWLNGQRLKWKEEALRLRRAASNR